MVASGRAAIGRGGSTVGSDARAHRRRGARCQRQSPRRTTSGAHRDVSVFSVHGNPMARASDRTEAALVTLIVVTWVLCLPVAAAGGSKLWADIAGTDRPQQQTYSTTNRAH